MSILLFPGQGSQYEGMGKDLYETMPTSRTWFDQADELLGFSLSKIMFEGSCEELLQTSVTQPAVFLNSIIRYYLNKDSISMDAVAGHSLGELTALVANNTLSFENGLKLVSLRASAMQQACNDTAGTMAAILGLDDVIIENLCRTVEGVVVAANYNCPGQLVISGEIPAVEKAVVLAKEQGAKRALVLPVNGAFHSPLMSSAKEKLAEAISEIKFENPTKPIYQNVSSIPELNPNVIQSNLIEQMTNPVKWTQSMQNMKSDGYSEYTEFGAKVLSGFVRRLDRTLVVNQF